MSTSVGVTVWHRGDEIPPRARGPEPRGVSRTDFFLGPEKNRHPGNGFFPSEMEGEFAGGGGRAPGDLVVANRMKTKDKGGRPAHAPDDRSRQMVEVLSGFEIPQDKIADVIGVDGKTLRKALRFGTATRPPDGRGEARRQPAQACQRQRRNGAQGDHVRLAMPAGIVSSMRRLRRSRSGRSARRSSCRWRLRPRTPATAGANCCSDRLELRLRRLGATPQGRPVAGSRPAAVQG